MSLQDRINPFEGLEREQREGIEHYKPGQHRAFRSAEDPDSAVLIYVGAMGWAVIAICERERGSPDCLGHWLALYVARRTATGLGTGFERTELELTERSIAALDHAEVVDG